MGNNGKIQERLRRLDGVLLLWGPEAKPILDPSFPTKETVDVAKYLDLTRWLECANGGKCEWGTGAEEKASSRPRPAANQVAALPADQPVPLVFGSTNVNICLFQQFSLFRRWWAKVEHLHQCGFGARILMTAAGRAIVDPETDLLDSSVVHPFLQANWLHVATHWGPTQIPPRHFAPSTAAQIAVRKFYHELHELEESGGWGSAGRAALGKMEYHVPTAALLTSFQDFASSQCSTFGLPDHALKCAIRHFDLRVVHDCNVLDWEVAARCAGRAQCRGASPPPNREPRSLPARLLSSRTKDPITLTDVGAHLSNLKGSMHLEARMDLLRELADMGLGFIREGRRLPNHAAGLRSLEFHRSPLTPQISARLEDLNVPLAFWTPQQRNATAPHRREQGKP